MLKHLVNGDDLNKILLDKDLFWDEYVSMLSQLLNCRNPMLVSESDKKELQTDIKTPLERGHLTYLIGADTELNMLRAISESRGVEVFVEPIFYGFGALQTSNKQAAYLTQQFSKFRLAKNDAIFVIFLGVTSHWTSIVIVKRGKSFQTFYMDSFNLNILECDENQIPAIYDLRMHQRMAQGKPKDHYMCHFTTKMAIHSLVDIRYYLLFLQEVLFNGMTYHQHVNSRLLHCRLKHFWKITQHLRPNEASIDIPMDRMSFNEDQLALLK